jgi:hypothetical protein
MIMVIFGAGASYDSSQDHIFELASDLNIGSDVVWKQAQNKGLQIVRS